jgi:hypothetical protein
MPEESKAVALFNRVGGAKTVLPLASGVFVGLFANHSDLVGSIAGLGQVVQQIGIANTMLIAGGAGFAAVSWQALRKAAQYVETTAHTARLAVKTIFPEVKENVRKFNENFAKLAENNQVLAENSAKSLSTLVDADNRAQTQRSALGIAIGEGREESRADHDELAVHLQTLQRITEVTRDTTDVIKDTIDRVLQETVKGNRHHEEQQFLCKMAKGPYKDSIVPIPEREDAAHDAF